MGSPIEAVVLDLGGVVCRFVPDRRLDALSRMTGAPAGEIQAALWDSGLDARVDAGDLDRDEAYAAIQERLGGGMTATDLRVAWAAAFEPDEDVLALVEELDRTSVLFSNDGPIVDDCLRRELASVGSAFDMTLLSWRLGVTKPDPEAFVEAASQIGVPAQAVLYVDDTLANVRAAAQRGWLAHPYRGARRLRRLCEAHELVRPAR